MKSKRLLRLPIGESSRKRRRLFERRFRLVEILSFFKNGKMVVPRPFYDLFEHIEDIDASLRIKGIKWNVRDNVVIII